MLKDTRGGFPRIHCTQSSAEGQLFMLVLATRRFRIQWKNTEICLESFQLYIINFFSIRFALGFDSSNHYLWSRHYFIIFWWTVYFVPAVLCFSIWWVNVRCWMQHLQDCTWQQFTHGSSKVIKCSATKSVPKLDIVLRRGTFSHTPKSMTLVCDVSNLFELKLPYSLSLLEVITACNGLCDLFLQSNSQK